MRKVSARSLWIRILTARIEHEQVLGPVVHEPSRAAIVCPAFPVLTNVTTARMTTLPCFMLANCRCPIWPVFSLVLAARIKTTRARAKQSSSDAGTRVHHPSSCWVL